MDMRLLNDFLKSLESNRAQQVSFFLPQLFLSFIKHFTRSQSLNIQMKNIRRYKKMQQLTLNNTKSIHNKNRKPIEHVSLRYKVIACHVVNKQRSYTFLFPLLFLCI